jgi:endonuclease YncB( thermonuclease family)
MQEILYRGIQPRAARLALRGEQVCLIRLPVLNSIEQRRRRISLALAMLLLVGGCDRRTQTKQQARPQSREASGPQSLSGHVIMIADGDTITLLDSANTQHRIRLAGIDAPESHQAFGEQSRLSLSEMIFGKDVSVTYQKIDQYGRLVGKIVLDGKDINLEQVKAGMAWHYKFYEDEQTPEDRELYSKAEAEARAARRGLWQDPSPIEPYQFRKEEKRERRDAR